MEINQLAGPAWMFNTQAGRDPTEVMCRGIFTIIIMSIDWKKVEKPKLFKIAPN